jgi:hypothetical protein
MVAVSLAHERVVTRGTGCGFPNDSGVNQMMFPPRKSAARVGDHNAVVWKLVYWSPFMGDAVESRRMDRSAEST